MPLILLQESGDKDVQHRRLEQELMRVEEKERRRNAERSDRQDDEKSIASEKKDSITQKKDANESDDAGGRESKSSGGSREIAVQSNKKQNGENGDDDHDAGNETGTKSPSPEV